MNRESILMHVLYVHQNFPAQFGHIAARLVEEHNYQCTFVTHRDMNTVDRVQIVPYVPIGGATEHNSILTRTFENCNAHAQGVYAALRKRTDFKPDLIVAHSGFGSSLFLREWRDVPIINLFEFFYRPRNCDMDFRPDTPVPELYRLRAYTRNAMIMLDLENCDAGYTPTGFQRSLFPEPYQSKLSTVFDGIDTSMYQRIDKPNRNVGDRAISPDTRIVTYCARGFEKMRGFDIFMRAAKRIYEQHADVVFIVVGTDRVCYGDGDAERQGHASFREAVLAEGDYDLSKFIFTGRIPPNQLVEILSMGDAHIYLTVPFVLSWSMMNALACGAVVVASDTAPVQEMITDGRNGLLVDFFDEEAIAARVLDVLRDPPAYDTIRTNARAFIEQHYSVDAVLPQMMEMYQRVASNGR